MVGSLANAGTARQDEVTLRQFNYVTGLFKFLKRNEKHIKLSKVYNYEEEKVDRLLLFPSRKKLLSIEAITLVEDVKTQLFIKQ